MTGLLILLSNARTVFDLTEPDDQASLYALAKALLELPGPTSEALQEAAQPLDAPL